MPPKKRRDDKTNDEKFVYVLTLRTLPIFGDEDHEVDEIAAIYASKAAAVEDSGGIETRWGTFDIIIEKWRKKEDCKDDWIDNRKNPPDDGCLVKVTNRVLSWDCDFDYVELTIQKFLLLGEAATERKTKAK